MSRLCRNLQQQILGFQIKVYVESFDDMHFYQLFYACLMTIRDKLREKTDLGGWTKWNSTDQTELSKIADL